MQFRKLGRTGVWVSEIAFGCAHLGVKPADEGDAVELVHRALDLGINFFDTANIYAGGRSEEILGKALKGVRDQVVLATKVRGRVGEGKNDEGLSRYHIIRQVDASLRRLQTDYIDLYQVHWWDENTPLDETLQALDDVVRQGKVLYVGCSNFNAWQWCKALGLADKHGWARFETDQVRYSLLDRSVEADLVPFCVSEQKGLLAYSPMGGGLLAKRELPSSPPPPWARAPRDRHSDNFTDRERRIWQTVNAWAHKYGRPPSHIALAWVLHCPAVSAAIIGASNTEQLNEVIGASGWRLSDEAVAELDEVSKA
ncbi:General stress protein 69 [bacterium HR17]|uniref:General stress protein 69 n=1 Tax=Candidatus Fervidibacter japonicus TaxID=2035412 RepID=A0A2H5XEW7_9BACT|nr:General stress protein 69 [bacterium HR17]